MVLLALKLPHGRNLTSEDELGNIPYSKYTLYLTTLYNQNNNITTKNDSSNWQVKIL